MASTKNIRTLYHGGPVVVANPQYGYVTGRSHDFGIGFYCTPHKSSAMEWAVAREQDGFVSRYSFDTRGLRGIDLRDARFSPLHWIYILLRNRLLPPLCGVFRDIYNYILNN